MDDPGCAFADEYADHVEAQRIEVRSLPGEIVLGKRADGGLLVGGDGFEWIPEAQSAAHLDLDEDERLGSNVQTLTGPELVFRALLRQDGAQRLELARRW